AEGRHGGHGGEIPPERGSVCAGERGARQGTMLTTPSIANSKGLASPNPGICFLPHQWGDWCITSTPPLISNLADWWQRWRRPLSPSWWGRKQFQHLSRRLSVINRRRAGPPHAGAHRSHGEP